jgi:hypothetical protein
MQRTRDFGDILENYPTATIQTADFLLPGHARAAGNLTGATAEDWIDP